MPQIRVNSSLFQALKMPSSWTTVLSIRFLSLWFRDGALPLGGHCRVATDPAFSVSGLSPAPQASSHSFLVASEGFASPFLVHGIVGASVMPHHAESWPQTPWVALAMGTAAPFFPTAFAMVTASSNCFVPLLTSSF